MVEDELPKYEVVLTPQFIDDLEACVTYISRILGSPQAAKRMYEVVREKVSKLSTLPEASVRCVNPKTGTVRYKISYNKYDIYYRIEGERVRVLGIKHQFQNARNTE